jgi:protease-4
MLQGWMDEVYEDFKGHVLRIRGDRLKKPIDELAGGRVYTGQQALELGLVDRLGSLDDAIEYVADKAGLKDDKYVVRVIPRPKNFVEMIMSDLSDGDEDPRIGIRGRVDSATRSVWQAALPLLNSMQPQRAAALRRALLQMEILQRESISLMMPEIVLQ